MLLSNVRNSPVCASTHSPPASAIVSGLIEPDGVCSASFSVPPLVAGAELVLELPAWVALAPAAAAVVGAAAGGEHRAHHRCRHAQHRATTQERAAIEPARDELVDVVVLELRLLAANLVELSIVNAHVASPLGRGQPGDRRGSLFAVLPRPRWRACGEDH